MVRAKQVEVLNWSVHI